MSTLCFLGTICFPESFLCDRVTAPLDSFRLTDINANPHAVLHGNIRRHVSHFKRLARANPCSFRSNMNAALSVYKILRRFALHVSIIPTHNAPDSLVAFKNELPTSPVGDKLIVL